MQYQRIIWILLIGLVACTQQTKKGTQQETEEALISVPTFVADSAFAFIQHQVEAGPRVPGTKTHTEVGDYFVSTFNRYGAKVVEQPFEATIYTGQLLSFRNIIASFNTASPKRILLAAHWDTRPFADKDVEKPDAPFDGANDGASGVGVLLEVARQLSQNPPPVGVDLILFDGEDWGERNNESPTPLTGELKSWWCLGSQYWANHKHEKNYAAYYGVLLDMVGGDNAQFHREGVSMTYAPGIVKKVWDRAHLLGYSDIFVKQTQASITDDHVFINSIANIPTIDIVAFHPDHGYFGEHHHTRQDNLSTISKKTLNAVGSTLLHVIYHEK